MTLRCVAALLAFASAGMAQRLLLISLDGFGDQALTKDQATADMPALRSRMARGIHVPMQPAFPSTTANGHAALATGAWGDVNGIHANSAPILPRSEHSSFERREGFRADGLTAEPIWVAAARQGIPASAINFVGTYPFLAINAPPGLPLTLMNSYQTRRVAPNRLVTAADVEPIPCDDSATPLEASRLTRRCFEWREGSVTFRGSLGAARGEVFDHIDVSSGAGLPTVRAWAAPLETEQPEGRELARHFTAGLRLVQPEPAVVYFRLFDLAADGGSFTLFQSAVEELAIRSNDARVTRERVLEEVGGVIGNSRFPGDRRPDVTSMLRALEVQELVIRQQARLQRWFWSNAPARLQVAYMSNPDEAEHAWLGVARTEPRFALARRWIYQAIDQALEPLMESLDEEDHLLVVSDHGMGVVNKQVRIYPALERAGLVVHGHERDLDRSRSKLSYVYNCLLVNTDDWKDGIVPVSERAAVVDLARRALGAMRDPDTGAPVFQGFYSGAEDNARFGFGGEAGADLCFDPAPGYFVSATWNGPEIEAFPFPRGQHGAFPLREDMRSMLIGFGPRLRSAEGWPEMRAIDVAPLVADLLSIDPPADSRGRSPLP